MFLYSSDKYPGVQLVDHIQQVVIFFLILEESPYCFHSGCTNLHCSNSAWGIPFFQILTNTCYALPLHVYHPEVALKFSLRVISESGSWSLRSASLALLHPWVVQEWVWSVCRFMHRNREPFQNPFRPLLFVFSSTQTSRGYFFHSLWRERQGFL